MSKIFNLNGEEIKIKKFEEPLQNITYKEIMKIVVDYATEETCKKIFSEGVVTMCPSEVFEEIIDKEEEEEYCEYKSIGCSKCWSKAVKIMKNKGLIKK